MNLNWDTVRSILLALEASTTPNGIVSMKDIPGIDPQEVGYHMELMAEEELIILLGKVQYSHAGDGLINVAIARRLTMAGHKLLDTLRNDTVWNKVKARFTTAGVAMSLATVGPVADAVMKKILQLPD